MSWELFDRDGAGGVAICGVDGAALDEAPVASLPVACEIVIGAESAAPGSLDAAEHDIASVTRELGGRIVATARTRTSLTTLVYLSSDEGAEGYTRITLPRRASVSVAPAIDPDWTLFAAARPIGMEEQSMQDFRVRVRLHESGDVGGVRPIDHVVTGVSEAVAGDVVASIRAVFPSAHAVVDEGDDSTWQVSHQSDPTDVTESSWTIRLIAERFGATYAGWHCEVVRGGDVPGQDVPGEDGSARPERTGRRWFRRR